jgi:hypothetical protein
MLHLVIALCGADTWTPCETYKYLEGFEMWCWRRVEKISWTNRVSNEVLQSQAGEQYPTYNTTNEGMKANWIGPSSVEAGKVEGS